MEAAPRPSDKTFCCYLFSLCVERNVFTPCLRRFHSQQYLYTLSVSDIDKAEKLTQSLPPGLQRKDI
jgi:hypothetical protein